MDTTQQLLVFHDEAAFEQTDRPGFRRRIVTSENMQLCFWRIAGGSTGSVLHHHPDHEQFGIVFRGRLDMRIGDPESKERCVLGPGELYIAPPGVWHGDSRFLGDDEHDECWIIDVFSPPRDDWGTSAEAGKLAYGEAAR